jgi:hypothetical protein
MVELYHGLVSEELFGKKLSKNPMSFLGKRTQKPDVLFPKRTFFKKLSGFEA